VILGPAAVNTTLRSFAVETVVGGSYEIHEQSEGRGVARAASAPAVNKPRL
jgi:hypothetical protein